MKTLTHKNYLSILFLSLMSVLLLSLQSCQKESIELSDPFETAQYENLKANMRTVWINNGVWTKDIIANVAADRKDNKTIINQLKSNQDDLGSLFQPYFGTEAGKKISSLLKQHVELTEAVILVSKTSDAAQKENTINQWYANGDEIAAYFTSINPESWEAGHTKAHLKEYLDTTLEEILATFNEGPNAGNKVYEKIEFQLKHFADMLTRGIAEEHPEKF